MLKTYEALYIARPDVPDDEIQTIAKQVEDMITANGGAIVRSEIWGKRRLAYEVQKCTEGNYVLLRFEAVANFVARLENHFRLTDAIIRFLVVHFDEKTLRLEALQKKRKEAEIRNSVGVSARSDENDDDDSDRPRRSRRYRDDDDMDGE
ncbi:MAG: 30S ribosomal protein S6 [Candidatus Hydrogenedentes bacterium]|nr:30S ribosomal protein S6 [Candidatus Hydrogenedentota bacterium]